MTEETTGDTVDLFEMIRSGVPWSAASNADYPGGAASCRN